MSSSASTPTSTPTPQRWSTLRPVVSSTRSPSRTPEGYAELVEFANNHPMLRAWALEGTGGHGAGLSRHLLAACEIVIELDRPVAGCPPHRGDVGSARRGPRCA